MLQKFWPLFVLLGVGVVTLALLVRQPGGSSDEEPREPGEKQTLPGGLEIEDLVVGDGQEVRTGDTVEVHYTGTLASDGTKFDSSVGKKPFTVTLGRGAVIKGWDQGIPGMREGGRRKLYIPAAMAYGEQGSGDRIPPNADLVFEVKLLRKLK